VVLVLYRVQPESARYEVVLEQIFHVLQSAPGVWAQHAHQHLLQTLTQHPILVEHLCVGVELEEVKAPWLLVQEFEIHV